jgi:hypothetical protein
MRKGQNKPLPFVQNIEEKWKGNNDDIGGKTMARIY